MQNNNLDNIRMPRTKESTIFEVVFAVIILIIIVSLLLMALVNLIKVLVMPWTIRHESSEQTSLTQK